MQRAVFAVLVAAVSISSVAGELQNIYGQPLQSCSQPGTAMTGFTRDGHCRDLGDDDAGSHHICIKMNPDFCTVTGQPNWCGSKMPCMGNRWERCNIGNWCVCQWAFAGYLARAGGCEAATVHVQCDAVNMAAARAYRRSSDPKHKAALACLEAQCGNGTAQYAAAASHGPVDSNAMEDSDKGNTLPVAGVVGILAVVVVCGVVAFATRGSGSRGHQSSVEDKSANYEVEINVSHSPANMRRVSPPTAGEDYTDLEKQESKLSAVSSPVARNENESDADLAI